jgi:hypothetical protein
VELDSSTKVRMWQNCEQRDEWYRSNGSKRDLEEQDESEFRK